MAENIITEDMNIGEVIEKYPEVVPVFQKYNMGCIGCIAASFEKLSDIASVHGVDVKKFVEELNEIVREKC
jgi:hybrid cluster-associated redox disulfide protein